jgi:hypothetical protein
LTVNNVRRRWPAPRAGTYSRASLVRRALPLAAAGALAACGSDSDAAPSGVRAISIEQMGQPSVISDGDGRTRILTSFVARADQGEIRRALTIGETNVEFYLEGQRVSGESVLDRNELGGALFYTMVLDGSYSMLVDHQPPAFQPMLAAARASIEEVAREWQQRGTNAEVRFDWLWFDDYIHYPDDKTGASISQIPAPRSGENDTRLFGAVDYMFKRHLATATGGFATNPQDRHVMVVFTDGNAAISSPTRSTSGSRRRCRTSSTGRACRLPTTSS